MPNIEIRHVIIREHYAVINEMMRALHVSEKELFDKTADWSDIGESYMRHVIECQEDYDGSFLMAYVDGAPAGFTFGYADEEGDERIEDYKGQDLYVSDGYIKPEYRRLGIYKQLNAALERLYIDKGIRRILRYTLSSNTRMQRFLESQGFQPVRIFYEKWLSEDGKESLPVKLTPPGDGA